MTNKKVNNKMCNRGRKFIDKVLESNWHRGLDKCSSKIRRDARGSRKGIKGVLNRGSSNKQQKTNGNNSNNNQSVANSRCLVPDINVDKIHLAPIFLSVLAVQV